MADGDALEVTDWFSMAEVAVPLAVTGWFMEALISKLVLKGLSIFKDGLKGKLENLQNITVPQIKQVIEKAEMLGREDFIELEFMMELMMEWMMELQDAAYEADNVLDEYDYELLERQLAKGKFPKAVVSRPLSIASDASFRSKLEDSLDKLDKIASRVGTFTNRLGRISNGASFRTHSFRRIDTLRTDFFQYEPCIFGRDAERDHILDLLINGMFRWRKGQTEEGKSSGRHEEEEAERRYTREEKGKGALKEDGRPENIVNDRPSTGIMIREWTSPAAKLGRDNHKDTLSDHHASFSPAEDGSHKSESDHLQTDVPVLPIVGVGGVGKTTLALNIFNNPKIIAHFHTRMWIQTPHNFDEIVITRKMVESAHRQYWSSTNDNFNTLQRRLQEGLQKKRFLLVLDDVWYDEKRSKYENIERWRKLLAPLRHGGQGSVVLITTRLDLVAMTFSNALQPIRLEGLDENDFLSLFNRYAFGRQRPDDQNEHMAWKKIARKMVSELGGLPLAAKLLGEELRYWPDAKGKKALRNILDEITRVLILSYERLPPLLRQCVAHHGLYPKGLSFSGDYLVHAWIAGGFISAAQNDEQQESGDQSMEEIGSNCLNELVFRSFLQPTNDGGFMLPNLMHNVAYSVSGREYRRIQKGEDKYIVTTTKHLFIHVEDLLDEYYKEMICGQLRNLRTLFILGNSESEITLDHGVLHNILNNSKRLRTLSLVGLRIYELPNSIGDLKHLRFLDLSGSTMKTLPKSFHRLYHLLYLDLSKCKFDSVPEDLSKLVNLRHIEADDTTLSMIPNLGRLTKANKAKLHDTTHLGEDITSKTPTTTFESSLFISPQASFIQRGLLGSCVDCRGLID